MPSYSNWNELAQGIVNDIAEFKNNTVDWTAKDLKERLVKQGMSESDIEISGDSLRVFSEPSTQDEMEAGKIYFDAVYEEVDADPNWPEGA